MLHVLLDITLYTGTFQFYNKVFMSYDIILLFIEKVIVGSLNGIIRIFIGKEAGFKPEDLMLEMHLNHPILQVESGRFARYSMFQLHLFVLLQYNWLC